MSEFFSAAWIEPVATVLGVVAIGLMIRQSVWNFPIGLVQVVLSGIIFYNARFYGEVKLQALYFVMLCYGWAHWLGKGREGRGGRLGRPAQPVEPAAEEPVLPVTRLSLAWRVGYLVVGVAATLLWGGYMARATDAAAPYRDAFITSFSVLLSFLQVRKKIENWAGWVVVNGVASATYFAAGLYWFGVLYFFFLLLAVSGHVEWMKSYRKRRYAIAP